MMTLGFECKEEAFVLKCYKYYALQRSNHSIAYNFYCAFDNFVLGDDIETRVLTLLNNSELLNILAHLNL